MRPRKRSEFGIAIICALPLEADPIEALFDETYDRFGELYGKESRDQNTYITGRIGNHNVVLCIMPGIGRSPAASVASSLRLSFTGVQLALVVGICGATPYTPDEQQIFLGDVIISDSVIQYDLGRQYPGGFQRKTEVTDTLGRPSQEIRALLKSLESKRSVKEFSNRTSQNLDILQKCDQDWRFPVSDDILFESSFAHKHRTRDPSRMCDCFDEVNTEAICTVASKTPCAILGCDNYQLIRRRNNAEDRAISIHIGKIASADTVMKSGVKRDQIVQLEEVLGFEMEGAGVWDNISCIIIKGVCDYADSHKSKEWQHYAAAAGASAAKSFLSIWTASPRQDSFTVQLCTKEIPRVPHFIGRTEELKELRTQLFNNSIYDCIVILQGSPGIGKSSLVARYIEESHENHSAIFLLDASSPLHLAASFSRAKLQIEETHNYTSPIERVQNGISFLQESYQRYYKGKQSPGLWNACATSEDVQAVQRWLSKKGNNHWLLVFDNYRCSLDCDKNDQEPLIESFFPETRQGHIVITTHSHLSIGHTIRLEKIKCADQGLQILSGYSGENDVLNDPHAMELVAQMDGLPLALAVAGTYLSQTGIRCHKYLDLLDKDWARLQEENPRLAPYNGNLHSCWSVAFEAVRSSEVDMILDSWLGLHSQDAWPELLWRLDNNEIDFNRAIKSLRDYGIVETGPDPCDKTLGSRGYNMQKTFHAWWKTRSDHVNHMIPSYYHIHRSLTLARITIFSRKLIISDTYYEGLIRLLPHMNTCFDLVRAGKTSHYKSHDTLERDTETLEHLAIAFTCAGYGKSRNYSRFSAMLRVETPRRVHFVRAKEVLLYSMEKLEQVSTMDADLETVNHDLLLSLKLNTLRRLRSVYLYIPDMRQVEATSRQILLLTRLLSRHGDAQREQRIIRIDNFLSKVLWCGCFVGFIWGIYYWVLALSLIEKDTIHRIVVMGESWWMGLCWTAFMVGGGDRRKTFPLYAVSLVIFGGHSLYDDGLAAFRWEGIPMIVMAFSTIPVLYYEVLS